jgi:hypothetical protein
MARYIDADKLTNEIDEWLDSVGNVLVGKGMSYYGELLGCIEDTPTADVVEVVRCKDCCYANDHASICHYGVGREVKPDHYCGYGEKR